MNLADVAAEMQSLLDAPSPAVLTLYRDDGEALVSPVWFRVHDGAFEMVVAIGDRKLAHLRRDPRCVLLIFETVPPFRGVQVRGRAVLTPDEGAQARLAIASRYLGAERGRSTPTSSGVRQASSSASHRARRGRGTSGSRYPDASGRR